MVCYSQGKEGNILNTDSKDIRNRRTLQKKATKLIPSVNYKECRALVQQAINVKEEMYVVAYFPTPFSVQWIKC